MSSSELSLRCRCGQVRARAVEASPATTNRVVCYCRDCRAFARWLERTDVLDASGGTEIVQMARSRVVFDRGLEQLACMRLTDKGLFRWYASCCKTPIGNTVPAVPFIGVIGAFFDPDDAERRAAAIAAVAVPSWARSATGPVPRVPPLRMYLHIMRLVVGWWLRRLGGETLFDPRTRQPRVTPRVLTPSEREAIRD